MRRADELTREIRESPAGPEVGAFFDLDQTLLAGFSAFSFFRERITSGRISPREISDSLLGAFSFALGRTGFSGMMAATTAAYRGMAEVVLRETGQEVFEKHLAKQIYPEARALVEAHRARGHTLAIVSSATLYQVEPVAEALGIPHVLCTQLEVEHGVFTGRVVKPTCWQEGKLHYASQLAEREGIDLAESFFYTDSAEDLPLLEAVGRPRPLNPVVAARGHRARPRLADPALHQPRAAERGGDRAHRARVREPRPLGLGQRGRRAREPLAARGRERADVGLARPRHRARRRRARRDGRGAPLVAPPGGLHLQPPERGRHAAGRQAAAPRFHRHRQEGDPPQPDLRPGLRVRGRGVHRPRGQRAARSRRWSRP